MTVPIEYFDDLETRTSEKREAALMAALPGQIALAKEKAPGFARLLKDIDPQAITSRAALATLPVLRKADSIDLQRDAPPLGGLAAIAPNTAARLFASPGPAYEMETARGDYWRAARSLFAAGFRAGDVAHNSFSYHLTPGGWILDSGLRALGCAVVPAGTGNSEVQTQAIAQLRPSGFTGTPDFLKVLLDNGIKLGLDCSSITKALVSGGALLPALRQEYAERGVAVLQAYASSDFGIIAYESRADDGLIIDEELIVEILRPGTGEPLPEGEIGEVVITTLNPDYPLIRFSTGDLSALLPGQSACGRTNQRLKGWMGRADQTTKVKGMFVHPSQVAEVIKRHPEIARARLVVERGDTTDVMTLHCEISLDKSSAELAGTIAETLQAVCKLKGGVLLHEPAQLPNDGKIIEDLRSYD